MAIVVHLHCFVMFFNEKHLTLKLLFLNVIFSSLILKLASVLTDLSYGRIVKFVFFVPVIHGNPVNGTMLKYEYASTSNLIKEYCIISRDGHTQPYSWKKTCLQSDTRGVLNFMTIVNFYNSLCILKGVAT